MFIKEPEKLLLLIQIPFCLDWIYIDLFYYTGNDACKTCCYKLNTQLCEPLSEKILEDGRPCYNGFCKQVGSPDSVSQNVL